MATVLSQFLHVPQYCSLNINRVKKRVSLARRFSTTSKMEEEKRIGGTKLMEFPHLLGAHKDLMVDLVTTIETRLHHQLLPSQVPPDVQFYENPDGTSQGTLHIRSGLPSSPIDFILVSWLHLSFPTGGAFNITNIATYFKPSTDAPNLQFEFVQCNPTDFILFIDFIPRKDLVLNPDYLNKFYETTRLEERRQRLDKLPQVQPYFSSSLRLRSVVSPTAILVSIKCKAEEAEEIIRNHVSPVAKDVLEVWLDKCACDGVESHENERDQLEKRDTLIKRNAYDMDLSSSMPKQFGEEVATRVLRVIKSAFKI